MSEILFNVNKNKLKIRTYIKRWTRRKRACKLVHRLGLTYLYIYRFLKSLYFFSLGISVRNFYLVKKLIQTVQTGRQPSYINLFKQSYLSILGHLVYKFKYIFSVFKQYYYTYYHTFFHPHIFLQKLKIVP